MVPHPLPTKLHYRVIHTTSDEEKNTQLIKLLQETRGAGIVYAASIKTVERLHQQLAHAGEQATLLHAQLASRQRKLHQDRFTHGASRIMVATNDFGTGIDKPDVRFVIHYQIPANLETYYRESGRAGRDQETAYCTLLYHLQDKRVQQGFLARRYPDSNEVRIIYTSMQMLSADQAPLTLIRLQKELPQLSASKLQVALRLLCESGFAAQATHLDYRLVKAHAKVKELSGLTEIYQHKISHDREALDRMVFYAQTGFCRVKVMLEYFGQRVGWDHCGQCDNCLKQSAQSLAKTTPRYRQSGQLHAARRSSRPQPHAVGAAVRVPRFGEGRIVAVSGDKVTIVFPNSETRIFLSTYVQPA
ncbi:MAG: ATP-dependent helicase RecQ [Herminiimonas sp.]|nr:ATP-dependent helicase RecQ [Herminiimonas sp.]